MVLEEVLELRNVNQEIFSDKNIRVIFENLINKIDTDAKIRYENLRIIIYASSSLNLRIIYHYFNGLSLMKNIINCDIVNSSDSQRHFSNAEIDEDYLLKPPINDKLYFISPPSSPPEGWKPIQEPRPIIDEELRLALSKLIHSDKVELVSNNNNYPSIVLHKCEDSKSIFPNVKPAKTFMPPR
ncbi:Down syndrome candidate region 1-like protein 2 [Intoshia linei]|uniref:Down syndrome candidate region 1-like protein 2 n=1 Tax=Intoshia linei TaxID=1819745 RepID=A0A177B8I8_9BILA|nr:Down syndrome candidate region 1-like protein 2 [Intoshia linei]